MENRLHCAAHRDAGGTRSSAGASSTSRSSWHCRSPAQIAAGVTASVYLETKSRTAARITRLGSVDVMRAANAASHPP
jgi:hypothetical protein